MLGVHERYDGGNSSKDRQARVIIFDSTWKRTSVELSVTVHRLLDRLKDWTELNWTEWTPPHGGYPTMNVNGREAVWPYLVLILFFSERHSFVFFVDCLCSWGKKEQKTNKQPEGHPYSLTYKLRSGAFRQIRSLGHNSFKMKQTNKQTKKACDKCTWCATAQTENF